MNARLLIGLLVAGSMTGCASTQKASNAGQLQIRVAQIENQLDAQDRDISDIKMGLERIATRIEQKPAPSRPLSSVRLPKIESVVSLEPESDDKYSGVLRVPVAPQEVQVALQGAGYYKGVIDGKLGSGSQKAIKDFQTDNDLVSDGIVGQKTWALLKDYSR